MKNRDGYNRWILPKFPILLGKTYLKFKIKIDSHNLSKKQFFFEKHIFQKSSGPISRAASRKMLHGSLPNIEIGFLEVDFVQL